jgi:hypothetical protein
MQPNSVSLFNQEFGFESRIVNLLNGNQLKNLVVSGYLEDELPNLKFNYCEQVMDHSGLTNSRSIDLFATQQEFW